MKRSRGDGIEQIETQEVSVTDEMRPVQTPVTEMTVIGSGARLDGNLISAASLKIEGNVKGQITAEGDVIVAPEALVEADIRANNVTVAGRYKGDITAGGTLELASTAKVEGNVSCGSLIVNRGAIFSGQSIMGGQNTPAHLNLGEPVKEEA